MKLSTLILNSCLLILSASTTTKAWYFTTWTDSGCPFGEADSAYTGTGNQTCKKFPTGMRSLLIRAGSFEQDSKSYLEVWTSIDCKPSDGGDEVWYDDEEDECHTSGDISWGSYEVQIRD